MPSRIRSSRCGVLSSSGCTLPLSASRMMLSTSTSTFSGSRWIESLPATNPPYPASSKAVRSSRTTWRKRGACLFLVRPAPQQADQPFAAFVFGLGQREIAENGAGLLGSQFDQAAVEPDGRDAPPATPKGARRFRARSRTRLQPTCERPQPVASDRFQSGLRFGQSISRRRHRYRSRRRRFAPSCRPAAASRSRKVQAGGRAR